MTSVALKYQGNTLSTGDTLTVMNFWKEFILVSVFSKSDIFGIEVSGITLSTGDTLTVINF